MRDVVEAKEKGTKEYKIILDQGIYQIELLESKSIVCIKVFRDLLSCMEAGNRWIL